METSCLPAVVVVSRLLGVVLSVAWRHRWVIRLGSPGPRVPRHGSLRAVLRCGVADCGIDRAASLQAASRSLCGLPLAYSSV
ncbi:hypothetical protein EDB80DRAFT_732626 [Ilyonectria destructans]|nr:hypothetical protein EDB80DRAFT_732626 [Ilyonectria destructans]